MSPTRTTFSVVIPATNRPPSLDACLEAVRRACGPDDDIIVVDDTDMGSPAEIRNLGSTRAHGDVLVFVDADVVLHDDALERLRAAFSADPDLIAAFGSYDDQPPAGFASQFRNLLHYQVHHEGAGETETFWAGLGAIRRAPFLAIGGFDTQRFPRPMLEDVELGLRLTDAGHRIRLMPEVEGRHLKRWSLRSMLWSDFRNRGIPWTRLLIERRQVPATLNLGWTHRLTALTVVATPLLTVRTRKPVVALAGTGAMVWLNRRFYAVLHRQGGPRLTAAGIGLHALHHLAATSAVPFGILAHIRRGGATPLPNPISPAEAGQPVTLSSPDPPDPLLGGVA